MESILNYIKENLFDTESTSGDKIDFPGAKYAESLGNLLIIYPLDHHTDDTIAGVVDIGYQSEDIISKYKKVKCVGDIFFDDGRDFNKIKFNAKNIHIIRGGSFRNCEFECRNIVSHDDAGLKSKINCNTFTSLQMDTFIRTIVNCKYAYLKFDKATDNEKLLKQYDKNAIDLSKIYKAQIDFDMLLIKPHSFLQMLIKKPNLKDPFIDKYMGYMKKGKDYKFFGHDSLGNEVYTSRGIDVLALFLVDCEKNLH